ATGWSNSNTRCALRRSSVLPKCKATRLDSVSGWRLCATSCWLRKMLRSRSPRCASGLLPPRSWRTSAKAAFPLVLFGEPIRPIRALQVGLISQICAPQELVGEANALVARILRLDAAAARRCKEFFLAAQQHSFAQNCGRAIETHQYDRQTLNTKL